MRLMIISLFLLSFQSAFAEVHFIPPKGWDCINDPDQLPQKVQIIYIGAGKGKFSPSINLATEMTTISLDEYVTQAKGYHESQGETKCTFLGKVDTKSGPASILQIDRVTNWGNIRFIQGIIINNEIAYVITATCLREDFASLSPQFIKSIQSFSES